MNYNDEVHLKRHAAQHYFIVNKQPTKSISTYNPWIVTENDKSIGDGRRQKLKLAGITTR